MNEILLPVFRIEYGIRRLKNSDLTIRKNMFIISQTGKGDEGEKIFRRPKRDLDGGKRLSVKISKFAPEPYRGSFSGFLFRNTGKVCSRCRVMPVTAYQGHAEFQIKNRAECAENLLCVCFCMIKQGGTTARSSLSGRTRLLFYFQ